MKKLAFLILLGLSINACKTDGPGARSGELCFLVIGDKLVVSNDSKRVMNYDIIDADLAARSNRIPFDCKNFLVINPGESKTFKVDSLAEKPGNPLILTWWQCDGNEVKKKGNSQIGTAATSQVCTKPD